MRRLRSLSIFQPALQAGYATCAHASGTAEIQPDGRWTPILMKSRRRQFDPSRDSRQQMILCQTLSFSPANHCSCTMSASRARLPVRESQSLRRDLSYWNGGASGCRGVPPPPTLVGLLLFTTSSNGRITERMSVSEIPFRLYSARPIPRLEQGA
jgi:hypothetical protein